MTNNMNNDRDDIEAPTSVNEGKVKQYMIAV